MADQEKPAEAAPHEDTATAYHEAGHAVMALIHDRPVQKVSIVAGGGYLGICSFRKGVTRPTDDILEREILIALAGIAAEWRWCGRYDVAGAGRDLSVVRKLSLERVSVRQVERYERRMFQKAESILADEGHWAAVESIARALLTERMISGRAARHWYDQAVENG
jgi:ATP-dependent Zn protease